MNLQYKISSSNKLTWLLSYITIVILIRNVKGSDSNIDEWSNEYNQRLYSSLTGTIRELPSVDDSDDTDTRFQPPLDASKQDQSVIEGYRLENSQNNIARQYISFANEPLLDRHKRDVTQAMDGSGTDESSTTESSIETTQTSATVYLTLTDLTNPSTPSSVLSTSTDVSTTYQASNTTVTSQDETETTIYSSALSTEGTVSSLSTIAETNIPSTLSVTGESTQEFTDITSSQISITTVLTESYTGLVSSTEGSTAITASETVASTSLTSESSGVSTTGTETQESVISTTLSTIEIETETTTEITLTSTTSIEQTTASTILTSQTSVEYSVETDTATTFETSSVSTTQTTTQQSSVTTGEETEETITTTTIILLSSSQTSTLQSTIGVSLETEIATISQTSASLSSTLSTTYSTTESLTEFSTTREETTFVSEIDTSNTVITGQTSSSTISTTQSTIITSGETESVTSITIGTSQTSSVPTTEEETESVSVSEIVSTVTTSPTTSSSTVTSESSMGISTEIGLTTNIENTASQNPSTETISISFTQTSEEPATSISSTISFTETETVTEISTIITSATSSTQSTEQMYSSISSAEGITTLPVSSTQSTSSILSSEQTTIEEIEMTSVSESQTSSLQSTLSTTDHSTISVTLPSETTSESGSTSFYDFTSESALSSSTTTPTQSSSQSTITASETEQITSASITTVPTSTIASTSFYSTNEATIDTVTTIETSETVPVTTITQLTSSTTSIVLQTGTEEQTSASVSTSSTTSITATEELTSALASTTTIGPTSSTTAVTSEPITSTATVLQTETEEQTGVSESTTTVGTTSSTTVVSSAATTGTEELTSVTGSITTIETASPSVVVSSEGTSSTTTVSPTGTEELTSESASTTTIGSTSSTTAITSEGTTSTGTFSPTGTEEFTSESASTTTIGSTSSTTAITSEGTTSTATISQTETVIETTSSTAVVGSEGTSSTTTISPTGTEEHTSLPSSTTTVGTTSSTTIVTSEAISSTASGIPTGTEEITSASSSTTTVGTTVSTATVSSATSITTELTSTTPTATEITSTSVTQVTSTAIFRCPGHPFEYFNGTTCVNASGETWMVLNFQYRSGQSRRLELNSSESATLENQISSILSGINITCNESCITLYDTQEATPPDLQILVTLNVTLDSVQRLSVVDGVFLNNVTYNSSYLLEAVQMIINTSSSNVDNFTNAPSITTTTTTVLTTLSSTTIGQTTETQPVSTVTSTVSTMTPITTQSGTETSGTESTTIVTPTISSTSITATTGLSTVSATAISTVATEITETQLFSTDTTTVAPTSEIISTLTSTSVTTSGSLETITTTSSTYATSVTVEIGTTATETTIYTSGITATAITGFVSTTILSTITESTTVTVTGITTIITNSTTAITGTITLPTEITTEITGISTSATSTATSVTGTATSIETSTTAITESSTSTTGLSTAVTGTTTFITGSTTAITSIGTSVTETSISITSSTTTFTETSAGITGSSTPIISVTTSATGTTTPITGTTATITEQTTLIIETSTSTTGSSTVVTSVTTSATDTITLVTGTTTTITAPTTAITDNTTSFMETTTIITGSSTGITSVGTSATETSISVTNSTTAITSIITSPIITTITGVNATAASTTGVVTEATTAPVATTIITSMPSSTGSITTTVLVTSAPITTTVATTTSTTTAAATTMITTTSSLVCTWTPWVIIGNCTPSCGTASQTAIRSCINLPSGQSCPSSACGGGDAIRNQTCSSSPPCEITTVNPESSSRDPTVRIAPYVLPDAMYFFEQKYSRIWISSKGYISFDTPFYGRTMTNSAFRQIINQALVAPFWADLSFDNSTSNIQVNWFSANNASASDINMYSSAVQTIVNRACPTGVCSIDLTSARVVRIVWQNLIYESTNNQSISVSFTAYLINVYDYGNYYSTYPILRAYVGFDYTNLINNLGYLRPFVGYRGKLSSIQVLNDQSYYQNAGFLTQRQLMGFYVGGQMLTACDVSFLQETRINVLYPQENLNDVGNNPRFPCPCTLGQARVDGRFARLFSETSYELNQRLICYAPVLIPWVRWGFSFKLLRSQTCCYNSLNQGLITYGNLAGSVLSNPYISFLPYWQRRIPFYDQCCSPSYTGYSDWNTCRLYYQLHPPSTCLGYQPPAIVTGVGDPHVNTIDNGQYTCHIQGIYVFARTDADATRTAQFNDNSNVIDTSLLYTDDLFEIRVRSIMVAPALPYIERAQGYGSIFSSFAIIANSTIFNISNNNGKFGFTTNTGISLTTALANSLDYAYTNANYTDTTSTNRYIYRVTQTTRLIQNTTVPQLTFVLWSGVSLRCEIIGENLECTLSLPEKYRTHVEGLIGNFNGNPSDDLINKATNQTVPISTPSTTTLLNNDQDVLDACRSWKVTSDTTSDITRPILPTNFINWYYTNVSSTLTNLNPLLSPTIVNQTCPNHFECIHDYLIRINSFTSRATSSNLDTTQESRTIAAQMPPTHNLTLPIQIILPSNNTNRNYSLGINITPGANTTTGSPVITIYPSNITQTISLNGATITIPIPNNANDYVEVLLTVPYGNTTLVQYLNIVACLCENGGTCNFDQTTQISSYYDLAYCNCPDVYDGVLCESPYDGCVSGSACKVNWQNTTQCVSLPAAQQIALNRSYLCNGTCKDNYTPEDDYLCNDINECSVNSSRCGNGICINLDGSFTCNCTSGYRFNGITCININECTEPNADGSFPRRCNDAEICKDLEGNYTCECNPNFNTTGTCIFNSSLCTADTCPGINGNVSCLRGTININNICIPWCNSTCPQFCELAANGFYQCNCVKQPGYELSEEGKCVECRGQNYGYCCNRSCECVNGICNKHAEYENQSCTCDYGYQSPFCAKLIDMCAISNPCNNNTQICTSGITSINATCTCRPGYQNITGSTTCTDINECTTGSYICDALSSYCVNTIGSYTCACLPGFIQINNSSCSDIDECKNLSSCTGYANTYCANTLGTYECRCSPGYSVGGDITRTFENILNTSNTCIQTNYSSQCDKQCTYPAYCDLSGDCKCVNDTLNLVVDIDPTKQICQCPGYPYVNFTNLRCESSAAAVTWLIALFNYNSLGTARRINLNSPINSSLEEEVIKILCQMNKTCSISDVNINPTIRESDNNLEYFVSLSVALSGPERFQLLNSLLSKSISINDTYPSLSTIKMIINQATGKIESVSAIQATCKECEYLKRGVCKTDSNTTCECFTSYSGDLCRTQTDTSLQSSSTTNWTVIVAVISSIAGLLLIIALSMIIFYIIKRCRRSQPSKLNEETTRGTYVIPRAQFPTLGTIGRDSTLWDGVSLHTNNEQGYNAFDSYRSSAAATTFNPTYRSAEPNQEPIFDIFDQLERHKPLSRGTLPSGQMAGMSGTLNSFVPDRMDDPSRAASTFSDLNDLGETEFVTDMLDDMTKDDDMEDEFVEALNPNLAMPRSTEQSSRTSTGWFPFFHNS